MKNDIRFLVTKSCNYDCYFCHSEGVSEIIRKHRLSVEDYVKLYDIYSKMEGWNGVTLSGGEPLLFKDVDILLQKLNERGANITIVTNGSLLHLHLPSINYVKQLNVSIHTLNPAMYSKITNSEERKLFIVKENLKTIRKIYPEIEIRLNVNPCLTALLILDLMAQTESWQVNTCNYLNQCFLKHHRMTNQPVLFLKYTICTKSNHYFRFPISKNQ